jgi:membrane-bound lytic murein transglycosylase D
VNRLLAANGWNGTRELVRGEIVRIPIPASRAEPAGTGAAAPAAGSTAATAATAAAGSTPTTAATAAAGSTPTTAAAATAAATAPPPPAVAETPAEAALARQPPPPKEPVSQRQAESSALLPAASPTGNADTNDYGVGPGNTVVVQAAETLGHFADWTKISSQSLRTLNKLHKNAMVTLGHKIKLDLSRVGAAQFEAARHDYHRQLQETFFATHRISGTENYVVKRGESLWIIAQQRPELPVWLVAEYNPDVDFGDVRPGTTIALPRVEAINRQ